MTSLAAIAVAFSVAFLGTPIMRHWGIRRGRVDVPNERSSHRTPTPRTGGYAICVAIAIGGLASGAFLDRALLVVGAGMLPLVLLAAFDEVRELPRMLRLFVQIAVATAVPVVSHLLIQLVGSSRSSGAAGFAVALALTVFWVVGVTNAYNFMDGLNGIASAEAIVAGTTLGVMFIGCGDPAAAALAFATAAAAAGFLPWNLPSGSVFMGDTGSSTLGYLFALLVVRGGRTGVPLDSAVLVLLPFLLDAGVTLLRRAWRGERFFSTSHRSHFYQRLQQSGWSHAQVTGMWTALALTGAVAALVTWRAGLAVRAAALLAVCAVHGGAFAWIERTWRRHQP